MFEGKGNASMETKSGGGVSKDKDEAERVSFWSVAVSYLLVILTAALCIGVVASDFDSIADISLNRGDALPLIFPTIWIVAVTTVNIIRDCRNRRVEGHWVRSKFAPKSWFWTILGCAAMLIFLMFVTRVGKPSRETVDGVRWRYTVSNGNAVIGCAGMQNRPAISVSRSGGLTIPSTLGGCPVTGIGERAFDRCKRLTSVVVPAGVKWIGPSAFGDCSALTNVVIQGNVCFVGPFAFSGCSALKEFVVQAENQSCKAVNGLLLKDDVCVLAGVNGDVVIPEGVTSIGAWAFEGRCALKSVAMPASVTNVEDYAFMHCGGLRSVTIPCGVQRVGVQAFMDCGNLLSISVPESLTDVGADAFNGCQIKNVYVEKGDMERVKEMLKGTGLDVDKVEFVERDDESVVSSAENPANGQVK